MIFNVEISSKAQKQLRLFPDHIVMKLTAWVDSVERVGLEETKKIKGFHDEALKGRRQGQRSIRLNKAYRAIYVILNDGSAEFVRVEEASKHEY